MQKHVKFGHLAGKSEKGSISNLSAKVMRRPPHFDGLFTAPVAEQPQYFRQISEYSGQLSPEPADVVPLKKASSLPSVLAKANDLSVTSLSSRIQVGRKDTSE